MDANDRKLYEAVLKKDLSLVKKLLVTELNIAQIFWVENQEDSWRWSITPLEKAIELDCTDIVKAFLEIGDISSRWKSEYIVGALEVASYLGKLDIMQLLFEAGSKSLCSMSNSLMADIALDSAVRGGQISAVKMLLAKGANINYLGDGGTPLMVAARDGYFHIVKFLVELGANVHIVSQEHGCMGALALAATQGHQEVCDYLFPLVADLEEIEFAKLELPRALICNERRNNPTLMSFFSAVRLGNINHIAEQILFGIDVNSFDEKGTTALHIAVLDRNIALVELLAEAGADLNIQDENHGYTPLIVLILHWLDMYVFYKMLADSGQDRVDEWLELSRSSELMVKTLIAKRVDIYAKDRHGNTVFSYLKNYLKNEPSAPINTKNQIEQILLLLK